MRNMRWIVAAGALSLALSAGCKKDTPAASAPASAPAASAPAASAPAAEKPAEPAKPAEAEKPAEPAKPAEAPAEPAKPAEAPPAEAPPAAPAAAAAGVLGEGLTDVPADAIAVASAPGVDALFNLVKAKADKFGIPLPAAKEQILDQLKAPLGLSAIDWLDTTRPVHLLAWNPNKAQGPVILLPITGKDKLVAAFPADKKENEQGNEFSFTIAGKPVYVNFLEGYVAVSNDAGVYALAKDFSAKVAALPAGAEADVRVATGNLRTIFADQLTAVRGQLDSVKATLKQQLMGDPALGAASPFAQIPGLDGILDWYFDIATTVMDESEAVGLALDFDDAGGVQLPFSLTYKADGKIAAFAKGMQGADLSFASAAPASAYLVFASEFDPHAMSGIMDFAQNLVGTALSLTEEEKGTVKKQMEDLLALSAKKAWVAIYPDGSFPMAFAGATAVTDGKKYQELYDAYTSLLFSKAVAKIKPMLPPQFQAQPMDTFAQLVTAANNLTQGAGVKLAAGTEDVDGVPTSKLTIELDLEKIAALAGPEKTAQITKFTAVLGTKVEFAIAFGADKIGTAFGPNGAANAAAAAKGTLAGGTDTSHFAKNAAMLFNIDAAKAIAAWRPVVALANPEAAAALPTIDDGTSGGFAIGATDSAIQFSLFGNFDALMAAGVNAYKARAAAEGAPVEAVPVAPEGGAAPAPEGGAAAPAPAPEGGAAAPAPAPADDHAAPAPAPAAPAGGAAAGQGVIPQ